MRLCAVGLIYRSGGRNETWTNVRFAVKELQRGATLGRYIQGVIKLEIFNIKQKRTSRVGNPPRLNFCCQIFIQILLKTVKNSFS